MLTTVKFKNALLVALISELSNRIRISIDAGLVNMIVRNTVPLSSLMWYNDWLKLTVRAAQIYIYIYK